MRRYFMLTVLALAIGQAQSLLASEPFISEVVAANDNSLRDDFGDSPDWIEIHNPSDAPLNLGGWGLSDDLSDPHKWIFPSVSIPPHEYLLVHASGNNIAEANKPLHASFRLSRAGEFLGLAKPEGSFVDKYEPNFPAGDDDWAYGVPMMGDLDEIIPAHSTFRYLIPGSSHSKLDWENPDFKVTSSWKNSRSGFGFDKAGSTFGDLIKTKISTSKRCIWLRKTFRVNDLNSISALVLRIRYDDGFIASINGTKVAESNAPDRPRYNSYASGRNTNTQYVDFDLSEHINLLKSGNSNVLTIQAYDSRADRSKFFIMPTLLSGKSTEFDKEKRSFLSFATPGRPNASAIPPRPGIPTFSKGSSSFKSSVQIALEPGKEGDIIRYTTDQSIPTQSSKKYTGKIRINKTTMLTARCFDEEGNAGVPVSHTYLQLATNARTFSSNLPVVVIENFRGGGIPPDPYKKAHMSIYEPGEDGRTRLTNDPTLDTRVGIKIRGSSSLNRAKKAFTVEARDAFGEDKDISPLGLPEDSDWILYAPYNFDRALIRNALVYELSNQIGRYAVRTRFCEVFVNTNGGSLSYSDYVGVYVFMEKITRSKDRVNVTRISPEDNADPEVTGGYMFKIDRPDPGDSGFSAGGQSVKWVEPKEDEVTSKQSSYIRTYFNNVYKNLSSSTKYDDYIDPLSWVDHHMINEFTKNPDGLRLSTYFFKDRNKRLEYGPVWDFDRTMGCDDDGRASNPVGWSGSYRYGWWGRVMSNKAFKEIYAQRWAEVRGKAMTEQNIFSVIDEWEELLEEAAKRNFTKWRLVNTKTGFKTEINQLKSWVSRRLAWMDTQFDAIPAPILSMTEGSALPGFNLGVRAQSDEVYFTLDGTDPRLPNGKLNPLAKRLGQAEAEVIIPKGSEWRYLDTGIAQDKTDWKKLDFDDGAWPSGKSELGYGDGDEATAVERGPSPSSKYRNTIYFRRTFDFQPGDEAKSLFIKLLRDDGAVIHLNGEEIVRSNMPSGTIRYRTYSANRNPSNESRIFFPYFVDQPEFRTGKNVLAVEVHRGSRSDKDLSFNLEAMLMDAAGIPIPIEKSSIVTVRAKSGTKWSAPAFASVTISDTAALHITELMYNPVEGKAMEYIELKNASGAPVPLTGVSFTGVNFTFSDGVLEPWRSAVIISNDDPVAFARKYPNAKILGTFGGALSNGGEEVSLLDPDGQRISTIRYGSQTPWPEEADGLGSSLERISLFNSEQDLSNWRASLEPGGTPGDVILTEINRTGDGRISVKFLALPGNSYSLHATSDLGNGQWEKLEDNAFVTEQKVVDFLIWPDAGHQFYRVASP